MEEIQAGSVDGPSPDIPKKTEPESADPAAAGISWTKSKVLTGVNVYYPRSALELTFEIGEFGARSVGDLGDEFRTNLIDQLGDIEARCLVDGAPIPPLEKKIIKYKDFFLLDLFLHLLILIQGVVRTEPNAGKVIGGNAAGHQRVVIEYELLDVSKDAATLALELINHCLAREYGFENDAAERFEFQDALDKFRRASLKLLYFKTNPLARAARHFGIPRTPVFGQSGWIVLGVGKFRKLHKRTVTEKPSRISHYLVSDKFLTVTILNQHGFPTPRQEIVKNPEQAVKAAKAIGYPVVVKPRGGSKGKGVSTDLMTDIEVRHAFEIAKKISPNILVENCIEGHIHRLFTINGELVIAYKKERPYITGDGRRTIKALIKELNSDPDRDGIQGIRIKIDDELKFLMKRANYELQTILPANEKFILRMTSDWSKGAMKVDMTNRVHPDIQRMASRLNKIFGFDILGIDYMTIDISRSFHDVGGSILELNQNASLPTTMTEWVVAARAVIRSMVPEGQTTRGPVALVMGTAHAQQVALALNHIMSMAGHSVGLILNSKSFVGGEFTQSVLEKNHELIESMINDCRVEAVIHNIDFGKFASIGTGHEWMDSVVVSGAYEGVDDNGKVLRKLLLSAAKVAMGKVVIDGDDRETRALVKELEPDKVCYVNHPNGLAEFPGEPGGVVQIEKKPEGDVFTTIHKGQKRMLANHSDIPALKGQEGEDFAKSIALAIAAALDLGVTLNDLQFALSTLDAPLLKTPQPITGISKFPCRTFIALCNDAASTTPHLLMMEQVKDAAGWIICVAMTGRVWLFGKKWGQFDDKLAKTLRLCIGEHGRLAVADRGDWRGVLSNILGAAKKKDNVLILTDNPEFVRDFLTEVDQSHIAE